MTAKTVALGIAALLVPLVAFIFNSGPCCEVSVLAATPSFTTDVAPILRKNCLACHSSTVHKNGLVLETYSALMKGGKHGQPIVPHDVKNSLIIQMLEGDLDPQMPLNADPLSAQDITTIKSWIVSGAEGPAPGDATQILKASPIPEIKPEVPAVSPVTSVKFSRDGKVLAAGGYKVVRLIEPGSGNIVETLSGHAGYVRSIAFSPDGTLVAAAGGTPQGAGEIKLWNTQSHRLIRSIEGHRDCIYSIAWSPDGKLIASGSYDKSIKLWDAVTGKEMLTLQDHIDAVFAVAFSPDGKRLASASQDRTVKIWDVATGRRLYTLSDALDGLTSVAFSPGGDQLTAAGYDKTIYIWKLAEEDGQLSQSLIADQDSVLALIWSPDGKQIVSASSDGSIRFRDTRLDLIGVVDHQPDWVQALDISPDGRSVAAGRYNGTVSLYDSGSYKEIARPTLVFEPQHPTLRSNPKEAASR